MADGERWVKACGLEELQRAGSLAVAFERVKLALFWHEGMPWAISNVCQHRGGPLAEGRLRDEYVVWPWHAWEYSVKTGKGPPGYEGDAVATYAVELRGSDVWVDLVPRTPRRHAPHEPHPLARPVDRSPHERPRVLGLSTTSMDAANPRFSASDALL